MSAWCWLLLVRVGRKSSPRCLNARCAASVITSMPSRRGRTRCRTCAAGPTGVHGPAAMSSQRSLGNRRELPGALLSLALRALALLMGGVLIGMERAALSAALWWGLLAGGG